MVVQGDRSHSSLVDPWAQAPRNCGLMACGEAATDGGMPAVKSLLIRCELLDFEGNRRCESMGESMGNGRGKSRGNGRESVSNSIDPA